MSDAATQTRNRGVYGEICRVLETRKNDDETADEFKVRVMKEFNQFSEDEFNDLPETVQHWASNTSRVMQNNLARRRPQALPQMLGLDAVIRRYDITKPPEEKTPGTRRVKGQDAITRIFGILVESDKPEDVKAKDVAEKLKQKYDIEYSNSAVNQAIHAFLTARQVLGVGQNQRRQAAE